MTCAEFHRWLDGGMPDAGYATARDHAHTCPRCAAAFEAAEAVDHALSMAVTEPARAPARFTTGVMERVREVESLRLREAEAMPEPRWWISLLADPVSVVSATLALLAAGLWIWSPERVLGLGGRLGAHWLTWVSRAGEVQAPLVWLALLTTAGLLALWMLWVVARNLERAIILQLIRTKI